MGLFSGILGAVGTVFGGPLGGALGGLAGGLFDRGQEQDALDDRASAANAMELERWKMTNAANKKAATVAYRRDMKTMKRSDRMSDQNVRAAQRWQAQQALKAWDRTDKSALRARRWAKEDYQRQKGDVKNQFVRLREAAEKAGYNPLSVLGAGSGMLSPAGGITSSSYGAASGVGAAPVSGFAASTPMAGYGAPVHVAPLASNDAIGGLVGELGRELTGEAALDRQRDAIATEIASIELERMRGGFPAQGYGLPALGAYAAPTPSARMSGAPEDVVPGMDGPFPGTPEWEDKESKALQWPVEAEPATVYGGGGAYLEQDGRRTPTFKDDVEDAVARAVLRSVQDGFHKLSQVPGVVRDGMGWAVRHYETSNERQFVPRLAPTGDFQSFPSAWEDHPRLGGF